MVDLEQLELALFAAPDPPPAPRPPVLSQLDARAAYIAKLAAQFPEGDEDVDDLWSAPCP